MARRFAAGTQQSMTTPRQRHAMVAAPARFRTGLRRNVNDMFVNLSRRSQGLVERQLGGPEATLVRNIDASMEAVEEILKQLDTYLTPAEAEQLLADGDRVLRTLGIHRLSMPVPFVDAGTV